MRHDIRRAEHIPGLRLLAVMSAGTLAVVTWGAVFFFAWVMTRWTQTMRDADVEMWRKMWNASDDGRAEDAIRYGAEIATLRAELARTRADLGEAVGALRELYATVNGECPRLLNEDAGGNAVLDLAISALLSRLGDKP